ncbi:hypothetical protein CEDDRAFT_02401 [Frankia sp. CeD]|nr:hypothetical protein BMG523Draft_02566 [Frankia sp. BMG5.23]KEZ36222.1 hypothetical protein CEDDRAFT_02401 [Frankia sp. CeD]
MSRVGPRRYLSPRLHPSSSFIGPSMETVSDSDNRLRGHLIPSAPATGARHGWAPGPAMRQPPPQCRSVDTLYHGAVETVVTPQWASTTSTLATAGCMGTESTINSAGWSL